MNTRYEARVHPEARWRNQVIDPWGRVAFDFVKTLQLAWGIARQETIAMMFTLSRPAPLVLTPSAVRGSIVVPAIVGRKVANR